MSTDNTVALSCGEHLLVRSSVGSLWRIFEPLRRHIRGELLRPIDALVSIGYLIREFPRLRLLVIYVAAFLTNLIIIRRTKSTSICCSIALQFPIHSNFTVAGLINVTSARLFVDETDDAGVSLHIWMELGSVALAVSRVIHALLFLFLWCPVMAQ